MKYAVIQTGGKQYRVGEGDIINVDRLDGHEGSEFTFPVLLYVEDGVVTIGRPYIANFPVSGILVAQKKGEKQRIAKFKAKARYRKVIGFRSSLSEVKIEQIVQSPVTKETKKKKSMA